ncbi:WhiB family transcriptional regulator [Bifidobacterium miconisargentati]|uniref:WhiB family transcriptional regulator n=1 Tax=Bifidobacterium miconisargentati TaxID=2834437 RepID=UPI001BDD71C1|nr:WhiB family transcriptional regulator [Bifidobacterium miconisargentati]MBW3089250.1 WhiB family transcriptional regulator [Bifidobacterium miconisargentati]
MSGRVRAYCAELEQRNPHLADVLWHPAGEDGRRSPKATRLAIAICRSCPLRLECLTDAIVGLYDDDSIYGGMSRRERQRVAELMEADGVEIRRRDRDRPERRRRECLAWLRANPAKVAWAGDSHAYWSREWAKRKQKHAALTATEQAS